MTKYINDCGYVLSDTVYKDGNETLIDYIKYIIPAHIE